MFETAYSRIKSHPMIHAKISPSVAYAYVYAGARHGNHRRQFRIAQGGESPGNSDEKEGDGNRGSCARPSKGADSVASVEQ